MAIVDRISLMTSARGWLNRPGMSDDGLSDCIRAVEDDLNSRDDFRIWPMEKMITAVDVTGCVVLPNNLLDIRFVKGGTRVTTYHYCTPDQYADEILRLTQSKFYTIIGRELLFNPNPSGQTFIVGIYEKIPNLVNSGDTNWLLDKYPTLYLNGVLHKASQYGFDSERSAEWKNTFEDLVAKLISGAMRLKHAGSPLVPTLPSAFRIPSRR